MPYRNAGLSARLGALRASPGGTLPRADPVIARPASDSPDWFDLHARESLRAAIQLPHINSAGSVQLGYVTSVTPSLFSSISTLPSFL